MTPDALIGESVQFIPLSLLIIIDDLINKEHIDLNK
jgi:hypothetical protein